MECPKCQTENPQDNKFCRKCGATPMSNCFQCGAEVYPVDVFCGKCGQKIAEEVYVEKALPSTEVERKHVTVLFSDITGYTAMSEKLDPEEVKKITG